MKAECGNGMAERADGNGCAGNGGAFGSSVGGVGWIMKATNKGVERRAGADTAEWRGNGTVAKGCHGFIAGLNAELSTVRRNWKWL